MVGPKKQTGRMPAALRRPLWRLYLRRWLLVTAGSILFAYSAAFGLPVPAAVAGLAIMGLACAVLPREGLLRRIRPAASATPEIFSAAEALERLTAHLPEPAILLDRRGIVLAFNEGAGKAYSALHAGRHVSLSIRHPELVLAVNEVSAQQPCRIVQMAEFVPVERRMAAWIVWVGRPQGPLREPAVFMLLRDLTDQERIGQMRADFVANASHELRTPLASLLGFIETLRGAARDDAAAREHFLSVMAREAGRMKRLVDDLLSLSRIEMKAHISPTAHVEINEVIDYVVAALQPQAAEQGIAIEVKKPEEKLAVLGDREELVQVFQNLINNALQHGRDGGHVVITAERRGGAGAGEIAVAVADDGPGIAPEHIPRLTERFYRVNVSKSRRTGGTGLGLSIVKHVLARHGGRLQIASEVGRGSTFTVLLPQRAPTPSRR